MLNLMRNKKLKWMLLVFILILLILSFFIGKKIPWQQQVFMYDALRQTSILIFGLIGAWFAVLLPFVLEKGDRLKHFFSFSRKLFPALSSAIYLLVITLFIPFLSNISQNIFTFRESTIIVFNGLSLSIVTLGLLLLCWGLVMILLSFDILKKDIELKEAGAKLEIESRPHPKIIPQEKSAKKSKPKSRS